MTRTDIRIGNVFDELPKISDDSIDLVLTSPPYWGLRDYGVEGQLGAEPTMEAYLDNTLRWVKEVWRVLKPSGSFVLNIGDCFVRPTGTDNEQRKRENPSGPADGKFQKHNANFPRDKMGGIYKTKQLLSVSSFAYCRIVSETDFVCRGEHIWAKPNVPSPIRSRLKHSHEKLFWFVKDADKYYFEKGPWMKKITSSSSSRIKYGRMAQATEQGTIDRELAPGWCKEETIEHSWRIIPCGAKQNGFELHDKPLSEHIAPFPEELIRPYIKSLCPPNGVVCDPFLGSGTTMRVALEEQRDCIGIEFNEKYAEYAKKRVNDGGRLA